MFSNNHSKSTGSPLWEAEVKAVKAVNFVAMWLNLYPRTVFCVPTFKPFLKKKLSDWPNAIDKIFHPKRPPL